jgi:hypothetical protein
MGSAWQGRHGLARRVAFEPGGVKRSVARQARFGSQRQNKALHVTDRLGEAG